MIPWLKVTKPALLPCQRFKSVVGSGPSPAVVLVPHVVVAVAVVPQIA